MIYEKILPHHEAEFPLQQPRRSVIPTDIFLETLCHLRRLIIYYKQVARNARKTDLL